jgi:DNA invertase Pin-like site-specific DNA recombinase
VKAVGYVRVSTKQQAKGESLAAQVEAIEGWAEAEGHELVGVCRDAGRRGALDAADRPGLLEALEEIEAGHAVALAVLNLGRLARALHVQEAVLARVWEAGGCTFEVGPDREVLQDDPEDPMRTFVRQVMGAAHQLDAAQIRQRLQSARRRKRDQGGYVGGIVRYGWRVEGEGREAVLIEVEGEQLVLARMRKLSREDVPLRRIARMLNDEGVPTRRGGQWRHTTIRSALKARP